MSVSARVSVEDYVAGDWPPNSQLIEGEVVVNDPAVGHQRSVGNIHGMLWTWCRAAPGRGEAGLGCNWVPGIGANVYKPDVWWVPEERVRPDDTVWLDGSPDLVVEVRSPGTWRFDVGVKRRVYEAAGTAELWLVDPARGTLTVARQLVAGRPGFGVPVVLGWRDRVTSPLLVGFEVEVAELFGR